MNFDRIFITSIGLLKSFSLYDLRGRLNGRENRGDIIVVLRASIHSAILLKVATIRTIVDDRSVGPRVSLAR